MLPVCRNALNPSLAPSCLPTMSTDNSNDFNDTSIAGTNPITDEMMRNSLLYLLLQHQKKLPVKRSELIKHGMNSQRQHFAEVMKKVELELATVFGIKLVNIGKQNCLDPSGSEQSQTSQSQNNDESTVDSKTEFNSAKRRQKVAEGYILISKYGNQITDASINHDGRRDPDSDLRKSLLYLILTSIFMKNSAVDEGVICNIIRDMNFHGVLFRSESDFRKVIKMEYVLPGYLTLEVETQPDHDSSSDYLAEKRMYSWGPRAHQEFSKYYMLKFVVARFPGTTMSDFKKQYDIVRQEENELFCQESLKNQPETINCSGTGRDDVGSNLKARSGKDGTSHSPRAIDLESTDDEVN